MIISKDAIKNILNRILKLDKKVDSHKHNISDVNNLQTTLNGKASSSHTHTKSQITDMPTTMKNPNSITVQLNGGTTEGTNKYTYDGSSAKSLNITASSVGAAASNHSHSYLPLSGGLITDNVDFANGKGIHGKDSKGTNQRMIVVGADDCCYLGGTNIHTYVRSSDCPQYLDAKGNKYDIYHSGNFTPGNYALLGHSHMQISSQGRKAPMTGRNAISGIYCYSTSGGDSTGSTMPSGYCVVIGFGDGTGGSAEIAISYTGNGMWFRYLRDYQDNWSSWTRLK